MHRPVCVGLELCGMHVRAQRRGDIPAVVMYLRDEKDHADTSAEMEANIIG